MKKFEWDPEKSEINYAKHNVTFDRAETVFDDINAIYLYDDKHSDNEERFIVIGQDEIRKEITVCHCYRGKNDEIIRIISAREATKFEKDNYYRGIKQ